ncbi:polar amino acid transport system substrate-binding protein [Candidatus Planktophila dulcis]|uniref:Polar amino acid transport system substrate-binding protein n=1 Tax=Candidatus Planktophila dulcis TaxID=1884914 RepID=A0AAD0E5V8_9ACTN|nr:ABC transporter substrate-binding protein [Candidatus Planktophila dulcis]ASY12468.1 polar amino acid transport system substrate-binding protein [Candidatus Planktophila dulcis]ASY21716.1 polar amino acid transport system substrate-binding protein [Candidatus Planktophila dulcis]
MQKRFGIITAAVIAAALTLTGCGPFGSDSSDSASASCEIGELATITEGKLTIATGEPAYYPWVIDDKPESGEGFEGAVAYAVAKQLGFDAADVTWARTTFDSAVTPGEKKFDFNLQQFSITDDRKKAVDFSSPYYTAPQAIVSFKGSKIEGKTSLAELKSAKLGAAVGTTSLDAIENQIGTKPQVFNDNAAGVSALKNKQIDGLVVDLPTAFYLSGVEVPNGLIVGQLPSNGEGDQFGLLLSKGSKLTSCVTGAVDAITADGTLAAITDKWLATDAGAPVLKP